MDTLKRQFSWFGVALILFGTLLLLRKLHVFYIDSSQIVFGFFMLWGLIIVGRGFADAARGKVFWGTVMFLYGVFFFLRDFESLEIGHRMVIPATFLIFGLAFFMMFLNNFRDWHLLVPAFFMSGIGVAFILSELGYLSYWETWDILHRYWPIAIILLGIAVILRPGRRSNLPPPSQPSTGSVGSGTVIDDTVVGQGS